MLDDCIAEMRLEQASTQEAINDLQVQAWNAPPLAATPPGGEDMPRGDAWSRASSPLVTAAQLEARQNVMEKTLTEAVTAVVSAAPSS
eukprot:486922-Pyramimonas_sp.AAC.1